MSYEGTVRGGVIVPDANTTPLPEGTRVEIICSNEQNNPPPIDETDRVSLAEYFRDVIGKTTGLPEDAAYQHDHYLYGTPKKP